MSTAPQLYSWQRYLCPFDEPYSQTSDGFLVAPDASSPWRVNEHLRTIDTLADEPCLIILGEPGIGKSHVMAAMANLVGEESTIIQDQFASFNSGSELRSELFQQPEFDAWRGGSGLLYLFLDALDEAHTRIDVLMGALLRNLRSQPCDRLRLRLSCRSANWPDDYSAPLAACWQQESPAIYRLTNVSQNDVQLAADVHGIAFAALMRQLVASEVTPFAVIPITLELLLHLFKEGTDSLPQSRHELYAQGCQHLCRERNLRHTRAQSRTTTAEQRLLVAERLAALTLLAGRDRIEDALDPEFTDKTALPLSDGVGYNESSDGHRVDVNDLAVLETLDMGLFVSSNVHQYRWLHRTFQEYLAARYLVRKRKPTEILTLFHLLQDPASRFPPQLEGVAAWLATLSPPLKQDLLERDPVMLLRADAAMLTDQDRAALVDRLLTAVAQQQQFMGYDEYHLYPKLGHPQLAEQLRAVLTDANCPVEVRSLSIDLAVRNELQSLQDALLFLALNQIAPLRLRVEAAQAVAQIGDAATKAQLRPLLEDATDDAFQELKSAALRALWPMQMTATELFAAITPRGKHRRVDLHRTFLAHEIVDHLQIADLPCALAWVIEHTAFQPADYEIERLKDDIVERALPHFADDRVRIPLLDTLLHKLAHHDLLVRTGSGGWSEHSVLSVATKRCELFQLLFDRALTSNRDVSLLLWSRPALLTASDLPWLLNDFYPQRSTPEKNALVTIVRGLWYYGDVEQTSLVYAATQQDEILATHLAGKFAPIWLDSDEAQKIRERIPRIQRVSTSDELSSQNQWMTELDTLLSAVEQDPALWWRLNLQLLAYPGGNRDVDEHEPDITRMPGWPTLGEVVQQRILRTAEASLIHADPNNQHWLTNHEIHYRPAEAGYRALWLLCHQVPHCLDQLLTDIWAKWALVIVTASRWAFAADRTIAVKLVAYVAKAAPDAYHATAVQAIQNTISAQKLQQLTALLYPHWHSTFSSALWQQLDQQSDNMDYCDRLLPTLIHHDLEQAQIYVTCQLERVLTEQDPANEKTIMLASHLLCHAPDAGWSVLWPIVDANQTFGIQLFLHASHDLAYRNPPFATQFDVLQLAMLYQWLVLRFPYADDPPTPQGSFTPTPRYQVCRMRNSCLNTLVHTGTQEAVDVVTKLITQNPSIPDAKYHLAVAQEVLRRHTWQPIEPASLLRLMHSGHSENAPLFDQRYQQVANQTNISVNVKRS